jgi:putative phosphoesterase
MRTAEVGTILHLGDWTDRLVLDQLSDIAPTDGVAGNNDPPELREMLGQRKVIDIGGARFGLTHGHAGPGRTTRQRALRAFHDVADLDAILFGHSHIPLVERLDGGQWLINPGSPTDRRRQPHYTWALIEVAGGRIARAELKAYDDRAP